MILSCASAFVRHFVYFLSHAQIFKLAKHSVFPEFHSGLIWIQTVFANVEREREGERDWCIHILSGKSKCIGGSTSRERERERERERCVCVLFEFRHFILTLRTCLRISKFRVDLCVRDVLE